MSALPGGSYGTSSALNDFRTRSISARSSCSARSAWRRNASIRLRMRSSSCSSSKTLSTPARFIPSSVVSSWMRRSRSTSLWEYSRVLPAEREGSISPRDS